ncbi:unnamed protein product [Cochlearia groenlandica]
METTHRYHQSYNHHEGSSSRVSMNKNSQIITKIKPKIRIIHIFAPEIIKADVKNFRSLVQSLTGKPPPPGEAKTGKKRAKPRITSQEPVYGGQEPVNRLSSSGFTGLLTNGENHQVKEEWGSGDQATTTTTSNNTNTYFDLEGLIHDAEEDYFSSYPIRSSSSSQVESFIFNNNNNNNNNFDTKGHNSS